MCADRSADCLNPASMYFLLPFLDSSYDNEPEGIADLDTDAQLDAILERYEPDGADYSVPAHAGN